MALFATEWTDTMSDDLPREIADHLISLTHRITSRPNLAAAMFHATTAGYATSPLKGQAGLPLQQGILKAIASDEPTDEASQLAQLVADFWWKILVKMIVGRDVTPEEGQSHLRLVCRLLLADYTTVRH